ncbi:Protein of unknown function DUF3293 [Spirosomataceae bacterium]
MQDVNEKGNLMNKFEKLINEYVGEVDKSKYSSAVRATGGLRPYVKTIAILTAENPQAIPMSIEFNRKANAQFLDDLRRLKLGYRPTKGSYTSLEDKEESKVPIVEENSFIVNNISMESAIKLGTNRTNQQSIIYAETGNVIEDGSIAMTFRLIGTDKTQPNYGKDIAPPQNVFINRNNAEDFYKGRIGNRKFMIPFFGVTEYLVRKDGKYIVDKGGKRIAKKEKDYTDSKWEGGAVSPPVITTVIKDKEGNPMSDEKIEELENRINELAERCIRKSGVPALGSRVDFARLLREHQGYIKFVE